MGYLLPTETDWVTCSWQCHRDRSPASSEPGTDYGCAYGSTVYAVEAGQVTYVKTTNSGGMGRVVEYRLTDGRTTRSLHMSAVWVAVGQRLSRGQALGLSGASGYGDDWYYGPHDHQTLWDGPAWSGPTIDFHLYIDREEEDMTPEQDNRLRNIENMLAVPGAGYGYPAATLDELRQQVEPPLNDIQNRIYVTDENGNRIYDVFQRDDSANKRLGYGVIVLGVLQLLTLAALGVGAALGWT
jgi:hypothetical protein